MEDSVFTKIVKGELPSAQVYEDEHVIAIMDIFPSTKGQVVLFPKKQIDYVFDLPDELYIHVWMVTKKIVKALDTVFKPRRVCTLVEGFDVPHAHVKMYPVPQGESLNTTPSADMADMDELKELAEKIAKEIE